MPLATLSAQDRETVRRALVAVADGPIYKNDAEFDTLFGMSRAAVRAAAFPWPPAIETEDIHQAINNTFINLLGYPHSRNAIIADLIGVTPGELERVFIRWRTT